MPKVAPVVQVLMTVQFEPVVEFTILDVAAIRALFPHLPLYHQVERAGPMAVLSPDQSMGLNFVSDGLPRAQLLSEDLSEVVLYQNDRLSCGWSRIAPLDADPVYPGYSSLLEKMLNYLSFIIGYIETEKGIRVKPSVGELAYTDAFAADILDGDIFRASSIFTVLGRSDFRFNRCNLAFTKLNVGDYPSHSEITISGPNVTPFGQPLMHLQSVVRFKIDGDVTRSMKERFDFAHEVATSEFKALVKPDAFAISEGQ